MKIHGKESLKDYYKKSEVARDYESIRFSSPNGQLKHELEVEIIHHMIPAVHHNVLEIAAGTGRITREIIKKNITLTVVDSSPSMLNELSLPVEKMVADAFNLPFEDNSFDGVVTMRFIRHFELDERKKIYDEIKRVLKPEGYLIFDVCNRFRHGKQLQKRTIFDEIYTKKGIIEEMKQQGFGVKEFAAYLHGLEFLFRIGLFENFIKKSIILMEKLLRKIPFFDGLGYLWLLKCKKL